MHCSTFLQIPYKLNQLNDRIFFFVKFNKMLINSNITNYLRTLNFVECATHRNPWSLGLVKYFFYSTQTISSRLRVQRIDFNT